MLVTHNRTQWQQVLRRPRLGPELSLVQQFCEEDGLPIVPRGQELTLFFEPKLGSSYPDLVAVYWDRETVKRRTKHSLVLAQFDLRLMQYLYVAKEADENLLQKQFGRALMPSLVRLTLANVIDRQKGLVSLRPIEEIFAVKRIIALEAKMADWQEGLGQSVHNTWFASDSYLLLPHVPKSSRLMEHARTLGVGIVSLDIPVDYCEPEARREPLPQSHGCWLFNEWLLHIFYQSAVLTNAD